MTMPVSELACPSMVLCPNSFHCMHTRCLREYKTLVRMFILECCKATDRTTSDIDILSVLLEHGADNNSRASEGANPLTGAATKNSVDAMTLLLAKGANVKGTDASGICFADFVSSSVLTSCHHQLCLLDAGQGPLHLAARAGAADAANFLLKNGADINLLFESGYAPLHEAAADAKMAELLLSQGAEPQRHDPELGITPLHMAARRGSSEVCQLLLNADVDVNAPTKNGTTPLHEAAQHGHIQIIDLLVESGGDASTETKDGHTPLRMAICSQYMDQSDAEKLEDTVAALFEHVADIRPARAAWPELDDAA